DVSARVATTPTGLAAQAADEPRLDDAAESDSSEPDSPAPPRRRMPSRRGAAIGTAVHGVLEVVDLQGLDEAEFRRLAEVLAGEEEISPLAADVTERALAAARAPMVRAAVEAGAYWREVYLVVRDGDRVLEGYIDLLVRDDDRKLVVVDYKTDRAQTSSDLDSKTAHYRPQLAAYGRAVASVAQEPVSRGALVFAHADAAQQVDVPLDDH
ncbi:MAG TPA: PD-(D/E)XK nuclease family protein, partial [Mycobacteriales bacterium]|nr:PD-(D/E)XK nuclease family protein [Mycobacteriales bacterium]